MTKNDHRTMANYPRHDLDNLDHPSDHKATCQHVQGDYHNLHDNVARWRRCHRHRHHIRARRPQRDSGTRDNTLAAHAPKLGHPWLQQRLGLDGCRGAARHGAAHGVNHQPHEEEERKKDTETSRCRLIGRQGHSFIHCVFHPGHFCHCIARVRTGSWFFTRHSLRSHSRGFWVLSLF